MSLRTAEEFVSKVYSNVLLRPGEGGDAPTAAEIGYWVNELAAGNVTPGGLVVAFLDAQQVLIDHGTTEEVEGATKVKEIIEARIKVALEFAKPEVSGDLRGADAHDAGVAALAGVVDDATADARIDELGGLVNAGDTFTLTTGQDNPDATSGNDTFLGLVGTGATLTLGDVLNGGAGTDTLKLFSDNATVNLAVATISNVENVEVNSKGVGLPGTAGTAQNAGTLNLNSVAYEKAVYEGVTGDDATTVNSDTLIVNNANLATRVVLKDITDVASTVNFVGATGAADEATVEIAKATDTTTGGLNNNLTVGNIETLNLVFSNGANALNAVSAAQAKAVNVTVEAGSSATWAAAAVLSAAKALNIDASGNFTLGTAADLAADAVITVKGSGNVNLSTLEGDKTLTGGSVNAADLTGKLTVTGHASTASITSGSGADAITSASNQTVIVAGAGNDYVTLNAVDYGAAGSKTVAGGDGRDTVNVTASANLDAGFSANVTGFEVLDIKGSNGTDGAGAGNGDYNVDGRGFEEVTIGGALVKAATVSGITTEALTITASTAQGVTYALKNATGTSDALKVSIAGAHGNNGTPSDPTDDQNDLTVAAITTTAIETLTIESNTAAENVAGAKNTLTALNTDATKVVITGDHALQITGFNDAAGAVKNITINTIDASGSKGLIMGEGVQTVGAVSITGSDFADTLIIDAANKGANTINAGKGGDIITLGANTVRDTLILQAGDSQIGYADTNKDGVYTAAGDAEAFDIITGFASGTDLIDLGSFGFTGQKQSALANKTLAAADIVKLIDGTTSSIADFFVDTGVARGVAVVQGVDALTFGGTAGSTVAFIDVDGNGSLDAATDMMVVLTGVAAVTLTDFSF